MKWFLVSVTLSHSHLTYMLYITECVNYKIHVLVMILVSLFKHFAKSNVQLK